MSTMQIFDNFFREAFAPMKSEFNRPFFDHNRYQIYEKDKKYYVELSVAGLTSEDIDVNVEKEKRLLTIEAKKSEEEKESNESDENVVWYHKGQINQSFTMFLPKHLNLETVQAECKDGLLTVSFNLVDQELLAKENLIEVPVLNKA